VSTTDSHTGGIANAYTLAPGETFREYFANIKAGNFFLVARDLTVSVMTHQIVNWLDTAFKPEDALEGKAISTGNQRLDHFLNVLLSGALDERPFSYRLARSLTWVLSRSRIPSLIYLQAEENFAKQVDHQLRSLYA
jgi:hypothetical protein